MVFRYDNPALDAARVMPGLAFAAARTAYDLWNTHNPETFTTKKQDMALAAARAGGKAKTAPKGMRNKRPKKVQRLSHFSATAGDFAEKKWIDVSGVPTFTTTTSATLLNGLALGSDYFNRDGHNYVNSKIHLRAHLLVAGTDGTTVADTISAAVVFDRQSNGAAPIWSNVFQNTDNGGALTTSPMSQNNKENSDRFLVLYRKTWNMPAFVQTAGVPGAVAPQDPSQNWEISLHKSINLPTRCQGDTAVIGSILSGSIYFLTLGSQATADWQVTFNSRIVIVQK